MDRNERNVHIIEVKAAKMPPIQILGPFRIFEFLEVNDTSRDSFWRKKSLISSKRRLGRTG